MDHFDVFSTIYLMLASMSFVIGCYVLQLHFKGSVNRIFFLLSICMMLWALGFSVVLVAPNAQVAQIWTRVSAIGYELLYSVLVHFILLMTHQKKILNKAWLVTLLYLPAAICLYVFVLSPSIAQQIYHFDWTQRGWMRSTPRGYFDYFFNVYYIVAVLLCLILLVHWKRQNQQDNIRKQANLLLVSMMVAFGLGTLTDVLNGWFFYLPIPNMAPMLFLIPLIAIFYCIDRFQFMKPKKEYKLERILSEERRAVIFHSVSYGFILGGILLFMIEHVWWSGKGIVLDLFSSGMMIAFGLGFQYLRYYKKGFFHMEWLFIVASITLIPIVTIGMLRSGSLSIWVFPIMLIVCSLVFNSSISLLTSSISALLSQAYLLGVSVPIIVSLDHRTYIGRGVILMFIIVAAHYIHQIYVERLKENAALAKTQSLIHDIAMDFSLADNEASGHRIHHLLEKLAQYFNAETVLVHTFHQEYSEWIGTQHVSIHDWSIEDMVRCLERWEHYLQVHGNSRQEIDTHHSSETKEPFQTMVNTPWLVIPIYKKDKIAAFLYLETSRQTQCWETNQLVPLPVISRIVSDSLEHVIAQKHISFLAYFDRLTKLPNRQLFQDRAEQAINLARRNNTLIGFMFLDLDFFKSINDTMGHDNGDLLLQIVAGKLKNGLRKSDTVARFGGDEFLILLNHITDMDNIAMVADKIMTVFDEPIVMHDQELFITASAGISVFPADGEDPDTLIKHADIAMYTAKERGKNQYAFCSTNMKETVKYRLDLSNHLHRALERNELLVYYQPKIDLLSEKINGLEALIRWKHPIFGMIPPSEFISLAEQTGLINGIGNWVLETACRQVVTWREQGLGALQIAVNLSVVQLRNPDLVTQVKDILEKTGIEPGLVDLEITESAMTKEADYIIDVLNNLKRLGVSIAIDDFGTEYSSLSRLKLMPIDSLKMDMQFIQGIEKSSKDRAITMVVINLAKSLDLKSVAEGVENQKQLDFLRSSLCDEVQGFYFYHPMSPSEVEHILENHCQLVVDNQTTEDKANQIAA